MKKLLKEDDSTLNYNKWVKGIADREFSAQKIAVNSLFDDKNKDQAPNARKQQNVLPYPLCNLVTALGNAIVGLSNSISLIEALKNNPLVKHESNAKHIEHAILNLQKSAEMIQIAAKSVDNIASSI